MRCFECGSEYNEKFGSISYSNKEIGSFEVHNVTFYKCSKCENLLFPKETVLKIEKIADEIKSKIIGNFPISEFVSSIEACALLGISKQAFHKNRRIKRGFIYSFNSQGKRFYLKESVLLFKKLNDGRFPLISIPEKESSAYIFVAPIIKKQISYYKSGSISMPPQFQSAFLIENSIYPSLEV